VADEARADSDASGPDIDAANRTETEAETTHPTTSDEAPGPGLRSRLARATTRLRRTTASVVWLAAVLAALSLSMGALLIALGADQHEEAVRLVLRGAGAIDGPFWQLFRFHQRTAGGRLVPDDAKDHLVNWGLAALAYLTVGRVADRVIRP
jgi:hypothetical protein